MAAQESAPKRVTRREPVKIVVDIGEEEDYVFEVKPIPWRKRLDLGDALSQMYSAGFNAELQPLRDESGAFIGVSGSLFEAAMDYDTLFDIAFSTWTFDDNEGWQAAPPDPALKRAFRMLDFDQMVGTDEVPGVLDAALRVNGLDRIVHLLDPDRKKVLPTGDSATVTGETTDAGEKMESATASG